MCEKSEMITGVFCEKSEKESRQSHARTCLKTHVHHNPRLEAVL